MTHTNPNVRSDNEPLTQVAHEGNPVLFDLPVVGTLDSPEPCEGCGSVGGPVLIPPTGGGGGGGGGGSGQTPNNPLDVSGGEGNCFSGDGTVDLVATGGTPPYTWSTTVGTITVGSPTSHATLNPPTNSGASEAPSSAAYGKCASWCCVFVSCGCHMYNCNGDDLTGCVQFGCGDCCAQAGLSCSCSSCSGCNTSCCIGSGAGCNSTICTDAPCCGGTQLGDGCSCVASAARFCDMRSINGQSADCQPCAIAMNDGAVVTVTDATGQSASTSINYSVNE